MKKIFFSLLLLACNFAFAEYEFIIQPRSYWFSTHYDIYSGDKWITTIEKDWFHMHTIWSLCDEKGEYANGAARLLSPGILLNSMREIDVVDFYKNNVGYIQGNFLTSAAAKYVFYDQYQHPYATAYIDQKRSSVNIVDYNNERSPIAIFRRTHIPGGDYYWTVKVVNERAIDPKTLYVFAGFITDACWPVDTAEGSAFWDTVRTIILLEAFTRDE